MGRWPAGAVVTGVLAVLVLTPVAEGSDVEALSRQLSGHPPERFPLSIHVAPSGDLALDLAVQAAIREWDALFGELFLRPAFVGAPGRDGTAVLVDFSPEPLERLMGFARVDTDPRGVILLPVRVTLGRPAARGQTSAERVLFQVAAHELGHALGLGHDNRVQSLMCCETGAVDLTDPARRAAYVEARRHPSVRTAADQLAAHYRRFWGRLPPE